MQLRFALATLFCWCSFNGMGEVHAHDHTSTGDGVMATADRPFVSLVYVAGDDDSSPSRIIIDQEAQTDVISPADRPIVSLAYVAGDDDSSPSRIIIDQAAQTGVISPADRPVVSLAYFAGEQAPSRLGILVDQAAQTGGDGGDAYGDFGGATTGCAALGNCLEESFCRPSCGNEWTVAAEAVFLRRSSSDAVVLITDQDTGDTILSAEDFDFDYRGSPRLQLTRETCCCRGWEIGYLGVDSWFEARDRGAPISVVLRAPGLPLPSSAPGTIYRTRYGTDLHTLDVNYRCQASDWLTLVTGIRWAEINDEIRFDRIAPTPTEFFQVETNNDLVGWQFGGDASIYTGARCDISTSFTAGVYLNWAAQDINAPVFAGGPVADRLAETDQHVAFLSDFGIRAVYRLCPNVQLQTGYQLLWIDGIALAPAQIPANNLVTASAALDTNGDLFLHGATLGLVFTF